MKHDERKWSIKFIWIEAMNIVVYILNQCSTKVVQGKTPIEVYSGNKPFVAHFKVFGYECLMHILKEDSVNKSVTYSFIHPWGPKAINAFGSIIPWFRDMFEELERFFEGVSHKVSSL